MNTRCVLGRSSLSAVIGSSMFVLMAVGAKPAHAYVIQNGGFEMPVVGAGKSIELLTNDPRLLNWTIVAGDVDLVDKGANWPSFEGDQSLDLSGTTPVGNPPSTLGTIIQNFATTAGQTYRLTFVYANNPNNPAVNPSASAMVSVFTDPTAPLLSQQITHMGSTKANMQYTTFGQNFTATLPH